MSFAILSAVFVALAGIVTISALSMAALDAGWHASSCADSDDGFAEWNELGADFDAMTGE